MDDEREQQAPSGDDGLTIKDERAGEIARVTLILTEAGVTFKDASTGDIATIMYICETGAHGMKQAMFQKYREAMARQNNGKIVTMPPEIAREVSRRFGGRN